MSTTIRPEVSKKNEYWIERHRYYELKHFCMQYPIWSERYNALIICPGVQLQGAVISNRTTESDPVTKNLEERLYFVDRMEMLEKVAKDTDPDIGRYILKGVTEGIPYDALNARYSVPCCKDVYYDLYRRFFWLLDKVRQ